MKLFISVINHNHDEMIVNNPTLKQLATKYRVILKSNTLASEKLKEYCDINQIIMLQGISLKGFGANNNEIYRYAESHLHMQKEDFFLVLNPDVEISLDSIIKLINETIATLTDIAAINLFKDKELKIYDNSIRRYPTLLSPFKSLFGIKRKDIYDKASIASPTKIEWAAASFLLFKAECYQDLKGFDEKYFMYFEDADICTRANKKGFNIHYFPKINAWHYALHQNRKLFSKHFLWYWMSSLRYHLRHIKKR
jgi:GT2 family glycosyltransferase